ncbi:hypothetical protein DdX_18577 [Ditylenchus destructor]|uniref:Uncharacterized protein n=1 Tax=Ditylenchus destructor TaxID=166010 RepID=A0AAD4MJI9_9BILA|nr:hypothetical protein DdX_18577 [Ditylenchus destructor]
MQRSGPELMDLLQQWDSEMNDHERVRVLSAFKQSDGLADFEKLKRLTESIKKLVYVLYPDGKFQPEPIPQLIQLLDDFVSAGLVSAVSSTNSVEESIEDILLLAKQLIQTLQQTEEYVQACEAESSTAENNETLTGGVKADGELGINKDGGDQKPQSMQQLMDQLLQQLDIGKEEFKKDGLADFEKVIRLTELMKELLFVFYTDGKLPADAEPVLAKIEYFARVIEILFEEQNKPTYSGRDDKKIENVLIVGKLLIETLQQTKEYKQACGAESSTAENNESLTGGVKADGELGINKDGGDQNRIAPEGN